MFERIFNLLKQKGITQSALADKIGVRQATISDWKRKKTTPSAETIGLIADILGVSTDYLIKGKDFSCSPSHTVNQGIFGDKNENNTVTINGNSTVQISEFESELIRICALLDIRKKNALLTYAYKLEAEIMEGKS